MFWSSILPVTMFLLANSLCVSGAATRGRQWKQTEGVMSGRMKRVGVAPLSLQPVFSSQNFSPSSSVESVPQEWGNSHSPMSQNEMVDDEEESMEVDNDENDGTAEESDVWEEGPLPTIARLRFKYADNDQNDPLVVQQQPLLYRDRVVLSSPQKMEKLSQTLHYNPAGMGVVKRVKPGLWQIKRNQAISPRQATPEVMWSPAKSNYGGAPVEGFIRANGFDKRSPRCIAKCMQQGMVHPLQCHSLC